MANMAQSTLFLATVPTAVFVAVVVVAVIVALAAGGFLGYIIYKKKTDKKIFNLLFRR